MKAQYTIQLLKKTFRMQIYHHHQLARAKLTSYLQEAIRRDSFCVFLCIKFPYQASNGFAFLNTYIEHVTRWREDMNFIFEWQNNILRTRAASE